jgi:glucosamine--fructose-6-phosphate aminotransferase (isomerizing)
MTTQFERELREQPAALTQLIARGRPAVQALGEQIRKFSPRFVLIAARGSSDNAARYANYLFGVRHGLAAVLASPSLITRYQSSLRLDEALVFGVSQSGQSPDIVAMVEHARRQGALTIALTNDDTSPLARVSGACLPLEAGAERAVAASKTYSNAVVDRVQPFRHARGFVVIGRGFNISTACEIALKTMEMTYIMAQPFPLPDFLHGPIAMLDRDLPTIVVAMDGAITDDMIEFFSVVRQRQSTLIIISDRDDVLSHAEVPLPVPAGAPEWLSPLVAIVPGQFWALGLATARGLSPDHPRGLSKVTETE